MTPFAQKNNSEALAGISQIQQERLSYIDFRIMFLGVIQRGDLIQRFGMKEAAATRDISLYRKLAPQNLHYDTKARAYFYSDSFAALFDYTPERALAALSSGFGDDFVGIHGKPMIICETPQPLSSERLATLSVLTRAIFQNKVVSMNYYSLSNGRSQRQIVPFALVDNGLRWHIRAYDRKRAQFTDFVINRIETPCILQTGSESLIEVKESKDADIQWNRIVELEIVPHPGLEHPEAIIKDYEMTDGVLKINVRAVVAGYLLRRWNIDCSNDHSLTGKEYHLWLRNSQALYAVSNNVIAPGYKDHHE